MDVADYVNENPPSSSLSSIADLLVEQSLVSPIDNYRQSVGEILAYGTEARLSSNDFLGRLLVLGVVSAAEGYVRAILSSCMELCPIAQATAATKTINLGGLLWHGKDGFSRSAFEHASFSSKKELSKACEDFIAFKLEDATFKSILDTYESVCQLRHGIVHGDGIMPGRNAVQLEISKFDKPVRIVVRYRQLQEIAAAVDTLVATLNREIFVRMCRRWAEDWRRRADWDPANEERLFARLWSIFLSASERRLRVGRSKITRGRCMAEVKLFYGI